MNGISDELERSRPLALDELQILVERCQQGDRGALPQLLAMLDQHPVIWRYLGDLAITAETAWLDLICGRDIGTRECILRKLRELKTELGGVSPSPLERLLAERVTACWLQLHQADAAAAQTKDQSLKQADFALKRQDRAHQRYLTALGALATFKKLMPSAATSPLPLGGAASTYGRDGDAEMNSQEITGPQSTSGPEGPLRLAQCAGPIEIAPQESECSVEPGSICRVG